MPTYDYECEDCGIMEIFHGIMEDDHTVCPECGKEGMVKKISGGGAFIMKNKEPNQYNDCIGARTWRDKNGNVHKVTAADGGSKSPTTTSKKYRSDEQVAAMKKRDNAIRKQKRESDSYRRHVSKVQKKLGK